MSVHTMTAHPEQKLAMQSYVCILQPERRVERAQYCSVSAFFVVGTCILHRSRCTQSYVAACMMHRSQVIGH